MRILVFGKNGQVASELRRSLADTRDVYFLGSSDVNFLSPDSLVSVIREYKPSHIVNAAAYTGVDRAESEESVANQINAFSVGVIAEEAKKHSACFLHYSTDYVFDGTKYGSYSEDDRPNPINAYGRSKLLGEQYVRQILENHLILRVSWVYSSVGVNFYKTMLKLGAEREELKIVSDQIGAPTWSRDIAASTVDILLDPNLCEKYGTYHLSPQGEASWFDFANSIFEVHREVKPTAQFKIKDIKAIKAEEYPSAAKRPINSLMNCKKINDVFGVRVPHWKHSLVKLVLSED